MEVTSLDFNKQNPDLLIVGYRMSKKDSSLHLYNSKSRSTLAGRTSTQTGQESNAKVEGLICFWTVKNSEFPERVIKTHSGVTAIKFCKMNPYLFGVGMVDGTIAIYDMRRDSDK